MRNQIKFAIQFWVVLVFTLLSAENTNAEEDVKPYVDGSKSFLAIKNESRQADAWAMCSATYDVVADFFSKEMPARSEQLRNLSRGAKMAVVMSIVMDGLDEDISQKRFSSLWTSAKLAGSEIPKTARTTLNAAAESYAGEEPEVFMERLNATLKICIKNQEAQQMYIDAWRELSKTGLLTVPE